MMMSHIILTIFHHCLGLLLSVGSRQAAGYYKISTCNTITVGVLILLWVVVSRLLDIGLTVGWRRWGGGSHCLSTASILIQSTLNNNRG